MQNRAAVYLDRFAEQGHDLADFNFSRAAALSPSVWAAHNELLNMFRHSCVGPDTVVYMDYGAEELVNQHRMLKLFEKTAGILMERGIIRQISKQERKRV